MEKINTLEYNALSVAVIRSSFVGLCINNIIAISHQDNWISVIIGIIIGIAPILLYHKLYNENYDIKSNKFINIILNLFVFIFSTIILWNMTNFINTVVLSDTPNSFILIFILLLFIYIITKGIKVLARASVIFIFISFIMFIFSFLVLSTSLKSINIFPIMENPINTIIGSSSFIGYNITPLFILLMIKKSDIKENKNFLKSKIIFYLIATISLFIVSFVVTATYGYNLISNIYYPEFDILKRISLINFLERLENILSLQWLFDIIVCISLCILFLKSSLKTVIKNNNVLNISIILSMFIFIKLIYINNFIVNIISFYIPIASIIIFILLVIKKTSKTSFK